MSVASNLAALGALMKTNLEAKGVTGLTSDMGLTTLANKILEIPSGGPSTTLSLTGSSSIISSGETCSLSGLLTSNGQPVEDELIVFYNNDDIIPFSVGDTCENFIFKASAEAGTGNITITTPLLYSFTIYWNEHNYFYIVYNSTGQDVTSPNLQGDIIYKIGDTFITNEGDSFTLPGAYSSIPLYVDSMYHEDEFHPIIGAGFTNFQGIVSVDYVGTGFGDVTVVAEATVNGTFLQETFAIEDCTKYDTTEHSHYNTSSGASYNIYNNFSFDFTDYEVIFDMKSDKNMGIFLESPSDRQKNIGMYHALNDKLATTIRDGGSESELHTDVNYGTNYHTLKIEKQGNSLKFYCDNVLVNTRTLNSNYDITRTINYRQWGTGTVYVKNIKIKAL